MDLSFIIPCYNEGKKIKNTIEKLVNYMSNIDKTYEIIIVNDGSKDDTLKQIQTKTKEFLIEKTNDKTIERHLIITYKNNRGKGYAVKKGIKYSKGDYVLFMDTDLSTDLSAIKEVIKHINDNDVIIGSRRHENTTYLKKQPLIRQITGTSCYIITNIIIPLKIKDTQCGFKAFEGNFARKMIEKQTIERFAFDVEYLYIAKLNNKKIKEIPVIWANDEDSKVTLIESSVNFFKSLFEIKKNKNKYYFN